MEEEGLEGREVVEEDRGGSRGVGGSKEAGTGGRNKENEMIKRGEEWGKEEDKDGVEET